MKAIREVMPYSDPHSDQKDDEACLHTNDEQNDIEFNLNNENNRFLSSRHKNHMNNVLNDKYIPKNSNIIYVIK